MKRTAELRDLSEDHHHGLVQARRLREAASGEGADMTEASRAFLAFWQRDTSAHFRKEEEVLLPVLARHGADLLEREQVVRMLLQHARIRGLVMQLSDEVERGDVRPETLQRIGEELEAHIRLEERDVFPISLRPSRRRASGRWPRGSRSGRPDLTPSRGSRPRAYPTPLGRGRATVRAADGTTLRSDRRPTSIRGDCRPQPGSTGIRASALLLFGGA